MLIRENEDFPVYPASELSGPVRLDSERYSALAKDGASCGDILSESEIRGSYALGRQNALPRWADLLVLTSPGKGMISGRGSPGRWQARIPSTPLM